MSHYFKLPLGKHGYANQLANKANLYKTDDSPIKESMGIVLNINILVA